MKNPAGSFLLGALVAFLVAMMLWGQEVRTGETDTLFIMLLSFIGGVISVALGWFW